MLVRRSAEVREVDGKERKRSQHDVVRAALVVYDEVLQGKRVGKRRLAEIEQEAAAG